MKTFEVKVSPRVWGDHLAVYDEKADPPVIHLSTRLKQADAKTREYVIYHEIGHWFRAQFVPKDAIKGEETFAHDFASYLLRPKEFAKEDPAESRRMQALISRATKSQIRNLARKAESKL